MAHLTAALARALAHAHAYGVLHRDVKPSNVLVSSGGRPVLIDFGLAHLVGAGATLTASTDLVGTPAYLPPERIEGGPDALSERGDVYALGAVLYELLSGRPPFSGPTLEQLLRRIAAGDPPAPRRADRSIPKDLETICLHALERDPARRYPDAAALANDLEAFLSFRPIRALPAGPARRLSMLVRRHRVAAAAALLVVTLATATLVAVERERRARVVRATSRTDAALDEIERLLARARTADDAAAWDAAAAGLRGARRLAAEGSIARTTRGRLGRLGEAVETGHAAAAAADRNRRTASRLRDIAFGFANTDAARRAREFADAFREHGLDLESLSTIEAARAIRASEIRRELVNALDLWGFSVAGAEETGGPRPRDLVTVAQWSDDDPWRERWREAVVAADDRAASLRRLQELSRGELDAQPPEMPVLLAWSLESRGDPESARRVLRRARRARTTTRTTSTTRRTS